MSGRRKTQGGPLTHAKGKATTPCCRSVVCTYFIGMHSARAWRTCPPQAGVAGVTTAHDCRAGCLCCKNGLGLALLLLGATLLHTPIRTANHGYRNMQ